MIAKEVSEKQANCERDLAAAEPLVAQAEAALDTLNKKVGCDTLSKRSGICSTRRWSIVWEAGEGVMGPGALEVSGPSS